jgi:Periplasmic binding protein
MFISDVHSLGLKLAQGLTITEAYYWDLNDKTRAFGNRFLQRIKRMPTMNQAATYSATLHYLKAVQTAGTKDTKTVMEKMRAMPVRDNFTDNGVLREDGRIPMRDTCLCQLPALAKGPQFDIERPRAAMLVCHMPNLVRDRRGLNEKVVWPLRPALPRPLQVDHGVDDNIGDVHAFRTQIARHCLGKYPLRRLGRGETGETRLAPQCRGIPSGNDRALARGDHRRSKSPREVQQAHRIDLKIAVENLRIDLAECAECAADGVVDDDVGIAEIALYRRRHRFDLRRIGHVAAISLRAWQLFFQSGKTLLVPGEKGYAITAFGEPPGERRTRAGSDAGYQANWCSHPIKPPR